MDNSGYCWTPTFYKIETIPTLPLENDSCRVVVCDTCNVHFAGLPGLSCANATRSTCPGVAKDRGKHDVLRPQDEAYTGAWNRALARGEGRPEGF